MANKLAIIALGGNIGDVVASFKYARSALNAMDDCKLLNSSALYQSEPLGVAGQEPYLNAMLSLEVSCAAYSLLVRLHGIEDARGRSRGRVRWSARTLDLDLIDYAASIVATETLTLPHPEAHHRAFVLLPLHGIMPTWRHPILKKTPQQLLSLCDCNGIQRISETW